jgi:hypothetical protein
VKIYTDVKLHVNCGLNKQDGWVGIDGRGFPGVDIPHNILEFPWPLKNKSCHIALLSFVLDTTPPDKIIPLMDEVWRVLQPNGQVLVATHYAGSPQAYVDPVNYRPGFLPETFQFFDPQFPSYQNYKPKPWHLVNCQFNVTSVVNVIMEAMKRPDGKPINIVKEINGRRGKK